MPAQGPGQETQQLRRMTGPFTQPFLWKNENNCCTFYLITEKSTKATSREQRTPAHCAHALQLPNPPRTCYSASLPSIRLPSCPPLLSWVLVRRWVFSFFAIYQQIVWS